MIGRKPPDIVQPETSGPKGFDDFDLRLGDILRGERATMGKSLLDVQRELRIKASYIAAIENCDPSAFETPGFIAGYVRSYARYLNMDPDATFREFCRESGFQTAHGMSAEASSIKKSKPADAGAKASAGPRDMFAEPALPFAPDQDSVLSRIEPAAIGSTLVLLAVIAGIGYGGFSVLKEVQRVQVTPVDQTPVVLSDLDPLDTAVTAPIDATDSGAEDVVALADGVGVFNPPSADALDRLYRPQALDVPVLVARDAPISTLDPASVGSFADDVRREVPRTVASVEPQVPDYNAPGIPSLLPQVLEDARPGVTVVAVRPAWVRVRAADGTTIHEAIMNAGDTYEVPQSEEAPTIRVGESGAIYFAVNGQTYGPAGARGSVTSNLALSVDNLTGTYEVADISDDQDLARVVVQLNALPGVEAPEN